MRNVILFLGFLILGLNAFAVNNDSSPFGPELSVLMRQIDPVQDSQDGNKVIKVAKVTYEPLVDGGGSGLSYGLGVYLPKGAILKQSWFYTITQFTDDGTGTVAFKCEDANNIYTAADISGITAGTITAGNETGAASAMIAAIAAKCEITATVAANQTAGKLMLFVEYVVTE